MLEEPLAAHWLALQGNAKSAAGLHSLPALQLPPEDRIQCRLQSRIALCLDNRAVRCFALPSCPPPPLHIQLEGGPRTADEVAAVLAPFVAQTRVQAALGKDVPGAAPGPGPMPPPEGTEQRSDDGAAACRPVEGDAAAAQQQQGEAGAAWQQVAAAAVAAAAAPADPMNIEDGGPAGAGAPGPGPGIGPDPCSSSQQQRPAGQLHGAPDGGGPGSGRGYGRAGAGGRPPRGGKPAVRPAAAGCSLVAIRLTLEEAFFLHYVIGCLRVGPYVPMRH
jgi:hypothetical protein